MCRQHRRRPSAFFYGLAKTQSADLHSRTKDRNSCSSRIHVGRMGRVVDEVSMRILQVSEFIETVNFVLKESWGTEEVGVEGRFRDIACRKGSGFRLI